MTEQEVLEIVEQARGVARWVDIYGQLAPILGTVGAYEATEEQARTLNGETSPDARLLLLIKAAREMRDWIEAFESMVGKGMDVTAAFRHAEEITAHWRDLASHRVPQTLEQVVAGIRDREQTRRRPLEQDGQGQQDQFDQQEAVADGGQAEEQTAEGGQQGEQGTDPADAEGAPGSVHTASSTPVLDACPECGSDDLMVSATRAACRACGSILVGGEGAPFTEPNPLTVTRTEIVMVPKPCRHGCGDDVWFAEHHQTHGLEMFDVLPREDGQCLIDFSRGLYTVLQPTGGRKRRKPSGAAGLESFEGPFRYHVQHCPVAAQLFGWSKENSDAC